MPSAFYSQSDSHGQAKKVGAVAEITFQSGLLMRGGVVEGPSFSGQTEKVQDRLASSACEAPSHMM